MDYLGSTCRLPCSFVVIFLTALLYFSMMCIVYLDFYGLIATATGVTYAIFTIEI